MVTKAKRVGKPARGYKVIKKKLLQTKEELLTDISSSIKAESNVLRSDIGDLYDLASRERERELSLLLGEKDRNKLAQIDLALHRIEDGSYGVCESCGEKIAKARLLALPFTQLCIACKAAEEKTVALESKYEEEGGSYRDSVFTEEDES